METDAGPALGGSPPRGAAASRVHVPGALALFVQRLSSTACGRWRQKEEVLSSAIQEELAGVAARRESVTVGGLGLFGEELLSRQARVVQQHGLARARVIARWRR